MANDETQKQKPNDVDDNCDDVSLDGKAIRSEFTQEQLTEKALWTIKIMTTTRLTQSKVVRMNTRKAVQSKMTLKYLKLN